MPKEGALAKGRTASSSQWEAAWAMPPLSASALLVLLEPGVGMVQWLSQAWARETVSPETPPSRAVEGLS